MLSSVGFPLMVGLSGLCQTISPPSCVVVEFPLKVGLAVSNHFSLAVLPSVGVSLDGRSAGAVSDLFFPGCAVFSWGFL